MNTVHDPSGWPSMEGGLMLSLESLHFMGGYLVHNNVLCCCGYSALRCITYTTFSTGIYQETVALIIL